MSDAEKTYTLAEVRERERKAYAEALYTRIGGYSVAEAEKTALHAYPDPEPERRWVTIREHGGRTVDICRKPDGVWEWRSSDPARGVGTFALGDAEARAREVYPDPEPERRWMTIREHGGRTVDICRKPDGVWEWRSPDPARGVDHFLRAALEAVAAELAQPVVACQHRATRWVVVDRDGEDARVFSLRDHAETNAERWDKECSHCAPHRVVALAEVEG